MQILPKQSVTDGNIPTLNPIYYCTISPSVLLFPTFIFSLLVDENMNSKSFFFSRSYTHISFLSHRAEVPNILGTRDWFHGTQFSHKKGRDRGVMWVVGNGFRRIQAYYIYCAYYFYYYDVSSTSDY